MHVLLLLGVVTTPGAARAQSAAAGLYDEFQDFDQNKLKNPILTKQDADL